MARLTRAEALAYAGHALKQMAAAILSGKNVDDTDFTVPVSGAVTLAAGAVNIGDVDVLTVNGVAPQFDDTDKQAVSLYGKSSAAGDTALLVDSSGRQIIASGAGAAVSDGATSTAVFPYDSAGVSRPLVTLPLIYNGSTLDRQRSNIDLTVLASAARTAATNSADIVTYNARFLRVVVNVTAVTGSASLTFTVKAKDVLSGVYTTILASAAVIATGTTELLIGPGLLAAANAVANAPLPRTFRVEVAVGTADSATYSIGAVLSN